MSIQNNYSRRALNSGYLRLLEEIIQILSQRTLKNFLRETIDDQSFAKTLVSLYSKVSQFDSQKSSLQKPASLFQDLSTYLSIHFPDSRCPSSDSYSDNSYGSPIPFDGPLHTAKAYLNYPSSLEEIEEEDFKTSIKQETKVRFHSQARKGRDPSPLKTTFKHTLASTFSKPSPDGIMSKYLKMSENFTENKGAKEKSLFFNEGVFFHIP